MRLDQANAIAVLFADLAEEYDCSVCAKVRLLIDRDNNVVIEWDDMGEDDVAFISKGISPTPPEPGRVLNEQDEESCLAWQRVNLLTPHQVIIPIDKDGNVNSDSEPK